MPPPCGGQPSRGCGDCPAGITPRTVLSRITPGETDDRSRSVDVDVTGTGARNCSDTWGIGARLSPISGETGPTAAVGLPRSGCRQWGAGTGAGSGRAWWR